MKFTELLDSILNKSGYFRIKDFKNIPASQIAEALEQDDRFSAITLDTYNIQVKFNYRYHVFVYNAITEMIFDKTKLLDEEYKEKKANIEKVKSML